VNPPHPASVDATPKPRHPRWFAFAASVVGLALVSAWTIRCATPVVAVWRELQALLAAPLAEIAQLQPGWW
jgi:hypothetical protein